MSSTKLNQLERALSWVLRRPGVSPATCTLLSLAVGVRNLLRQRRGLVVPTLPKGIRPAVLAYIPGRPPGTSASPDVLARQLWAGYARYALPELERLTGSRRASPEARAQACWALARWHSAHGNYQRALELGVLMRSVHPAQAWFKGQILLEMDCLNRLNRADEARELLDDVLTVAAWDADYGLAEANTFAVGGACDSQLTAINQVLGAAGFAPLERRQVDAPLAIDNLQAANTTPGHRDDGPLVSILMPAHNAGQTLAKALRGLTQQTWRHLEIIPVDDCSTDDTWALLQSWAEHDARIRPVRHESNTGAYGARLTALEHANGEFITVHDADDWSHPQKIEAQMDALLAQPEIRATMSSWCRVNHHLYVNRIGVIPGARMQRQNESSLLFRRSLVDILGSWDRVRAGADTEFIWRIEAAYGKQSVRVVHPEVPLSFSLMQEDSLTRSGPTHVRSIFYGTRRVYREAQRWWHRQAGETPPALSGKGRPFAAPRNLLHRNPPAGEYDLLLVADFAATTGIDACESRIAEAAAAAGLRLALFHWRRYDAPAMRPMPDWAQAMAAEGHLDIIAAEDTLRTATALVTDPLALRHLPDMVPTWTATELLLLAAHVDESGFSEQPQYHPETIEEHARTAFQCEPRWIAPSPEERRRLIQASGFGYVADNTFNEALNDIGIHLASTEDSIAS